MTTPLEERLRATLAAEADRHPTTTDVEALRARADRTVVDLRLPPRRNRARIAAAAVVLAVLGLAVAAVVGDGDDGQPVATGVDPTPTGWYLPGPDWDVVSISTASPIADPGLVRQVELVGEDGDFPQALISVHRTDDPEAVARAVVPGGGMELTRGSGAQARTYRAVELLGGSAPNVHMTATRGDDVLEVDAWALTVEDVAALADAWWTSGGTAVPTPDGLVRHADQTVRDPVPAPAAVIVEQRQRPDVDAVVVTVEVRSPEGEQASYDLRPPDGRWPTGADGADDTGLRPDEVPRALPRPPAGGEAWALAFDGQVAAHLPGAHVHVMPRRSPSIALDLVQALRPASADRWAATADRVGADADVRTALLADVVLPGWVTWNGGTPTGEQPSTTATSLGVGEGVLELLRGVADGEADDSRLADPVVVGFVGDTDGAVALGGADRLDPERWELPLAGRWDRDDALSALDVAVDGDVVARHPGSATPACTGDDGPPADDVVLIEPAAPDGCETWSAVVVRIDASGLVADVRLALGEG